jgi:hypothetical protein
MIENPFDGRQTDAEPGKPAGDAPPLSALIRASMRALAREYPDDARSPGLKTNFEPKTAAAP